MDGVELNPYLASNPAGTDLRQRSGFARRISLRALQSIFLAILFCLSFLFLGCSARHGVTEGWDYTVFFVTEYPLLAAAIVVSNALVRGILFPRLQITTVWFPLVAGVLSFLSYNWVHFRVDAICQMIIPHSWDSLGSGILEHIVFGLAPSFVGILVEGIGHGIHLIYKRRMRKNVA